MLRRSFHAVLTLILLTGFIAWQSSKPSMAASASVFEFAIPGPNDTICIGDTTQVSAGVAFGLSYYWTPNYNISSITTASPLVFPATSTTYYCTISTVGSNLITNGNFSQGNTGFTSAYTYTTNLWPEATYYVGPNPTLYHANFASCGDHTTGNGNMMIVNGAGTPNINIWQRTVTVTPNTNYVFSCWLTSVVASSPAQLQFFVNNVQIGPVFSATPVNCNWNMFYNTWFSGAATTANIVIKNQNTATSGNDFALDDIYFAPVVTTHDSTLVVVENPVIDLGPDTAICPHDSLTLTPGPGFSQYLWSNSLTSPSIVVKSAGNYWVSIISAGGCEDQDSISIGLLPLPQITLLDDTICLGDSAELSAIGPPLSTYLWNTGTSSPSIRISPATTTQFAVEVTDSMGCRDTAYASVLVNPLPVVQISSDTSACEGMSVPLWATGGSDYLWTPSGDNVAAISVTATAGPTVHQVLVTDTNNCRNFAQVSVTGVPYPLINLALAEDTICRGESSLITASGGSEFLWSEGSISSSISVSPLRTATYTVTVSNVSGSTRCSSDSLVVQEVKNCMTIYIPNAIILSSAVNNVFRPVGELRYGKGYHLMIFDRWGLLLFETTDFQQGWDGRYKGDYVTEGAYVYSISVDNGIDPPFRREGTVTVLR